MWAREPRCDGWAKAWAMVRSSRSKNAQEKSPRVLMFVEYAARRRVAPISSVMARRAFLMTSKRTGSMAMAPMIECGAPEGQSAEDHTMKASAARLLAVVLLVATVVAVP